MKKQKKSFFLTLTLAAVGMNIIAVVSISALFLYEIYRANEQKVTSELNGVLYQVDAALTREIESLYGVTGSLSEDIQLSQAMEDYYSEDLLRTVSGKRMLDYILYKAIELDSNIDSIILVSDGETFFADRYSLNRQYDADSFLQESWCQKLLNDEIQWYLGLNTNYLEQKGDEQYYFCATKFRSKYYQNRADESRLVVVTYQINKGHWMDEMLEVNQMNLILQDHRNGQILCSVEKEPNFLDWYAAHSHDGPSHKQNEYIILEKENQLSGWTLTGFLKQADYESMVYPIQGRLMILLLFVLAVDLLLSLVLTRGVFKPLKKVIKGMEDIGQQNFYLLDSQQQYQEFDPLVSTFNHMSQRIQELLRDVAEKERDTQRAELQVLENQINPHFIYNTLDSARWMAEINNDRATAKMISALSRMFRIALSKGETIIPLSREIEFTREYLTIMAYRSNYQVRFQCTLSDQAAQCETLKMVLQPLVENCLIHGFSTKPPNAAISVCCSVQNNQLIISVEDNGCGIDPSSIQALIQRKKNALFSGIGIRNIEQRIRLRYGEEYGVYIQPQATGTKVIVTQPARPIQEEGTV